MVIRNLIEKISGQQRERQKAKEADYRNIIRLIADGKEPDADRVESILHDVGKSLEDLQAAVEQLQHRRELREQWNRLPALAAERKEIEAKMAAANKALEDADSHHTEVTMPLQARLQEIRDANWAAESAKNELWQTCDDPALKARLAEVQSKLASALQDASNLRTQIEDWKDRVKSDRAVVERARMIVSGERQVEDALDLLKQHEGKVGECEVRLYYAKPRSIDSVAVKKSVRPSPTQRV